MRSAAAASWHSSWRPARYGVTTVVAVFKAGIYMPAHEGIAMLASSEAVELDAEAAAVEEKLLQLKVEAAAAA
jgi:hypothetical protein